MFLSLLGFCSAWKPGAQWFQMSKIRQNISSFMVISRVFLWKFLKIHITSVSGCLCFTFKICQIVAGTSMIRRFHEFFESRFWRVFAILPNCVAWPGGTKHTKRRKCPLLGKSRVLPTHCRMCTRHQPLRRRRSESARSPPLCTLPLVPAGEIEGRPNQPFYDHIYFTRMAWQQSRRPSSASGW